VGGEGSHGHRSTFLALMAVKFSWMDVKKQSLGGLIEEL